MFNETAAAFLALSSGLFGLAKQVGGWRKDKREDASGFLLNISQCLSGIAANAEANTQIDDAFGELSAYMDGLMAVLKGVVDDSTLAKYSAVLNADTIQKKLILEVNDPDQRNEAIRLVREAAGKFRGLANHLLA